MRDPDFSRRRFLHAAAGSAVVAGTASWPGIAAADPAMLSFTAATNGAATRSASGQLVAEIQGILWSVPRGGGRARQLCAPDLEPTRPVFSPDGRSVAVSAYRGGTFHLWTLRPDGSGLTQVTGGSGDDRGPAWSPDGTRIAFASDRSAGLELGSSYRIWVVEPATGRLTRLTGGANQSGPLQDGTWEDFDPTWSPDGKRVLFVRAKAIAPAGHQGSIAWDPRTIASVSADGRGPVAVAHAEPLEKAQVLVPAVSPGGKLAYLRISSSCTLVVEGQPVPVPGDVAPVPPRWVGDDRLLLTVDGKFRIVSLSGAAGEEIAFRAELPVRPPRYRTKQYDLAVGGVHPVRAIHLPALSPDGRHVAFAALNSLWLGDLAGGRPPRRILQTGPSRYLLGPTWSPDGRALVYADDRDGSFAVRRREITDGKETVLASGGRILGALSPDGKRLASFDMAADLKILDLATGAESTVGTLAAGGTPGRPSWSPDGRYLALCDFTRTNLRFREGYNVLRIVDTHDGSTRLHPVAPDRSVSDRGDCGPVWSPDGRHFAVVVESALCLLPIRADGTPAGPLRQVSGEPADHPSWSADGRQLLYLSNGKLRLFDVSSGRIRTVPMPLDYRRPTPPDTVVHAGQLWDGTGTEVLEDVDIMLRGGRIAAVEPHRAGRSAKVKVDASARTVVPGLWDAHTHPTPYTYGARQSALQLAYGVTTTVSFGYAAYETARLREAIASGELVGPRLLTTGELVDGSRAAPYSNSRAHTTIEGVRRTLARGRALDWDFVKTYVRASASVMAEATRIAHEELGVRVGSHVLAPGFAVGQDLTAHLQATQRAEYGHVTSATGRAAQDVTEIYTSGAFHLVATPFSAGPLVGADPALAKDPRITRLMPPSDAALLRKAAAAPPTPGQLTALRTEMEIYLRLLSAGGLVALGSDQPNASIGLHLHLALRGLHQCGLSPAETLRTATVLPARLFGLDQDLGTVTPGKYADLTIIDGDPFTDFSTLVRTESVVRAGTLFTQRELVDAYPAP
ncbi:amidohydrolase family protein [Amycolatopsis jejuensis]|uniref:amidohydrolase family protein n=1 Tax=Amycolatopsis jejuensis TaxID=330084 RepID=UPI000A05B7AA|nr:amidohydrolase family protein [Amycolatopsis jejuensis]